MKTPPLPIGTEALNTDDTAAGTIINGVTFDRAAGEWTVYEIATAYGIELWSRRSFVLMPEVEAQE
jgi:hypothetical protein